MIVRMKLLLFIFLYFYAVNIGLAQDSQLIKNAEKGVAEAQYLLGETLFKKVKRIIRRLHIGFKKQHGMIIKRLIWSWLIVMKMDLE